MKVAALIPARKGSRGIPNKNFKEFCGKQLYEWTEDAAIDSGIFDLIIISSDQKYQSALIKYNDLNVFCDDDRPANLCTDTASLDDVLIHYAQKYPDIDVWCLLQPTSPLRTEQDIKDAYAMLSEEYKNGDKKYDSIVSVYNHPCLAWVANSAYHKGRKYHTALFHTEKRPNRQDRKDWFLENGAVYFVTLDGLKQRGSRIGMHPGLYVMPMERSFDIDNQLDWEICEMLMQKRLAEVKEMAA
jgi:CMP-N,N'-diacetyllegionaminic acid synthase